LIKVSDKIDLKDIERRAYTSYHGDGLADILVGLCLFIASLYAYVEMVWLAASMVATLTPMYMVMKKKYTVSRIGQVTFSKSRTGRSKNTYYFLIAMNFVFVFVGFLFWKAFSGDTQPQWMHIMIENYAIVFGVGGAAIWAVVSYITELIRFNRYALATLVVIGSANFIPTPFVAHMLLLSVIITASGYLQFQSFKRKYPIVREN
jgi:hypothetical protein